MSISMEIAGNEKRNGQTKAPNLPLLLSTWAEELEARHPRTNASSNSHQAFLKGRMSNSPDHQTRCNGSPQITKLPRKHPPDVICGFSGYVRRTRGGAVRLRPRRNAFFGESRTGEAYRGASDFASSFPKVSPRKSAVRAKIKAPTRLKGATEGATRFLVFAESRDCTCFFAAPVSATNAVWRS